MFDGSEMFLKKVYTLLPKPAVAGSLMNIMMVAGSEQMDEAKMIGMTPVIFSLIGSTELWPPYIFLPTTRFAY